MKPLTAFSTRAKNRTETAAMNGGLEIALTIVIFMLGGLALDRWLGTQPIFMIALFLFAAIACGLRYYYAYTADMEKMEAELRAARQAGRTSVGRDSDVADADVVEVGSTETELAA